jgi:hypothetical protein
MTKKYFAILSLALFVAVSFFAANVSLAQVQKSFGPAPVSEQIMRSNTTSVDNVLNANNRDFIYLSGTSSHQLNKQFLSNTSVTAVGSPFTAVGWPGATAWKNSTGTIYICNQASPFNIYTVDTVTGVCTQVIASCTGIPHANFTGMVWDHTTNTMFGCSSDLSTSAIFSINMTTGVCTPIGTSSAVCAAAISLSCAPNGTLFSVDIVGNNLYKWNKTTGVPTLVGALGVDANYGQDAAFDLSDGIFYWACAAPAYNLRTIDTTTGSGANIIGMTYAAQPSCISIIANMGPTVSHTPLPNTQNLAGPYVVNCVSTPNGAAISSTKLYWSRNNVTVTDSVTMTNSSGNNWTGNIPGNGSAATYRYYIKTIDALGRFGTHPGGAPAALNVFQALAADTSKPVITHTPIGPTPKTGWPIHCVANVTDNIGIDSVWVRWYKNTTANYKQFKLLLTSGTTYDAIFNSVNADVVAGDIIYYRVIAQDNSAQHLKDSTALLQFNIIAQFNGCVGTGSVSSNYPFTTYWMDGRTQMLFTAAELNTAGATVPVYIQKIGFNVITVGGPIMNGFNVRYQHTTSTSLTGFVETGWTTAFSGTYAPPATGWQYIDMTAPFFQYNGTSNLLVEICYDNAAYTAYSPVNATTIAGMTWGYYTDNVTGCTMTGGAVQAARPNTCFTMSPVINVGNNNGITPTKYSLSQNYPNPFNPVTRINFEIPKQGFVNVKIFDVLGREIRTLVNEVKAPGIYAVDFNASELSSGVYFYRLESNGFTDIKRMMLIK